MARLLAVAVVCALGLLVRIARRSPDLSAHPGGWRPREDLPNLDWLDERPQRDVRPDRLEDVHEALERLDRERRAR